jgi:hypothetical protein
MKAARNAIAFFLFSLACAHGQTRIVSTVPKDPEVKPEQRTPAIVHYEQVRSTARRTIYELAIHLQSSDSASRASLNETIDNEQDIVQWANWCILALRDKTAEASACPEKGEVR